MPAGRAGPQVAFLLDFAQLAAAGDLIRDQLVPALQRAAENQPSQVKPDRLAAVLEQLRAAGRIVLLVDAWDQAPPDGSGADALLALLQNPAWQACRVIVSGRPHALQRHWTRLFDGSLGFGWRFVQLDEFDESQQRQLLGRDPQGRQRYDLIQAEARDILATPRVLKYLRELPSEPGPDPHRGRRVLIQVLGE